jgi:Uma2 family endonuclease
MTTTLEKKLTWAEFREMEFDDSENFIYELIDGMIVKRTAPNLTHQRVSRRMTYFLEKFLLENPVGEFFCAPTDVALDESNGVVPDLSYVSKERSFILQGDDYVAGMPDVIFEIISPGNVRRDRVEKKELYEKFGLKEFWLIDPSNKTVEVFLMKDNALQLHLFVEISGTVASQVLTGFEVDASELFGA